MAHSPDAVENNVNKNTSVQTEKQYPGSKKESQWEEAMEVKRREKEISKVVQPDETRERCCRITSDSKECHCQ